MIRSSTLLTIAALVPVLPGQGRIPEQDLIRRPTIRPPIVRSMPVRTESTQVAVEIVDAVADTNVTLKFRNDGPSIAEKIVLFPLPKGATADEIEMMVGDKMQKGEILDKNKARGIYESIVRSRRDPALLEYMGRDLLRLRVFPIQPRSTQTVKVRFRMVLPMSAGLASFEFPTRAVEGGAFSLSAKIRSRKPIKTVYSPIAGFDVMRKDDHNATASFECQGRPKRDPLLFYGLSDRDFGLNLLTFRKQGQDGYFLAMIAPKRDWNNEKELHKSITFVLDTSGSMQGEKIKQAQGALRFFIQSLKPTDHFNIIPFSTEARPFAQSPVVADEAQIKKALAFTDQIEARGGTNIHEALTTALRATPAEGLVPIVVFLTDGLPTIGITDIKQILSDCDKANQSKARVFVFGVGNDVNTHLLDTLSDKTSGTRDYVRQGENIEVKMSALFEKLAHPVMRDVSLKVDGIEWSRLAPKKLGDMFRGSHIVVAGRYSGHGDVAIRLAGKIGDSQKEFVFDAKFPELAGDHDFIATIWAQRRVGQLLDAIRLNGQNAELVAEITRIGREHGIVTPYTSHLIVEEGVRVSRAMGLPPAPTTGGVGLEGGGRGWNGSPGRRRAGAPDPAGPTSPGAGARGGPTTGANPPEQSLGDKRVLEDLARAGNQRPKDRASAGSDDFTMSAERLKKLPGAASGGGAVTASRNAARLQFLASVQDNKSPSLWRVQRIRDRQFHLVGTMWIDGGYTKALEKDLRRIEAFSSDYFELLKNHPQLAPYLAFSTSIVIVLDKDHAVQITPAAPKVETKDPAKVEKKDDEKSKQDAKDGK